MRMRVRARRSVGRVLVAAALGAAATFLAGAAAYAQERVPLPATPPEQGIFEIRVGRIAAQTVVALVDESGRVLVPVDDVLRLLGMPFEPLHPDSARRVPLVAAPGVTGSHATLDLRRRTLSTPDSTEPLAPGAAILADGTLYMQSELFRLLLRADVRVDFGGLTVTFARTPPFPVEQQALTAARRSAGTRRRMADGRLATADAAYENLTGGTVLDWSLSTSPQQVGEATSLQGQLGLAIYGGSLTLGGTYFTGAEANEAAGIANYAYNTPESRLLRRVEVGDLLGGGAQLRTLRGASLTNARLVRDGDFGEVTLRPDIPSGWSYEVYQDGQLLGFAEAGHDQAVAIPLQYGTTPVQVRMLGPAGEEVFSDYRYQVLSNFLPPGTVEYAAGTGSCRDVSCGILTYGRMDWGVMPRLTLGASVDITRTDTSSSAQGAFRAVSTPRRDLFATLEVVPEGRSQVMLSYDAFAGTNASMGYGVMRQGGAGVSSVLAVDPRWFADARFGRMIRRRGSPLRSIRSDLHLEGFQGRGMDRTFGSVTADGARGTATIRYERDPSLGEGLVQLSAFTVLRRRADARLAYVPVSAAVGVTGAGLERLEGSVSIRSGRRGSLSAVARWSAARGGATLGLNYDALLGAARVSARVQSATRGRTNIVTSASGATGFSPRAGAVFLDQAGTSFAGVAGRVFYDMDGDGVFGAGDDPAPGLGVIAAGRRVVTDADGTYRSWNVLPFEVTSVFVDTLRDIQADFIPLQPALTMRATPNMFNVADFALVRTRELSGRIVAGEGITVVGGITVHLVNVASGDTLTALTFTDGEYYVSRVRPGTYRLQLAASSVAALRAVRPAPVTVEVSGRGPDLLVEIPPIVLSRPPGSTPATAPGSAVSPPGR
jgi:hypothetical protein